MGKFLILICFRVILIPVNKEILRGRVQFPTGGKVRDPPMVAESVTHFVNSDTDSKVWMREDEYVSHLMSAYI